MSLDEVHNVVLLFSNPTWTGGSTLPNTVIRNITALSSQLGYTDRFSENLTTLTQNYAQSTNGVIQGLLYVPDLNPNDACGDDWQDYIPTNVTRQNNLPPTNYNLIAIAPWINANCTKSFLAAARTDPVRAFVFYIPDSGTDKPPEVDNDVWNLSDADLWKTQNHFPIYAVPGAVGEDMMYELSLYSGNVSSVPSGQNIMGVYQPNPNDYVRIWTELRTSTQSTLPGLWVFVLAIIGVLILVIGGTSLMMHLVQNGHRRSLRRRVMAGEVNLEAMGIKRVTVPINHIQKFPLFTYNYDPKDDIRPMSPTSTTKAPSTTKASSCTLVEKDIQPSNHQPTCPICLEDFESRVTIIREIPCGHIFHPECIDDFLSQHSSLCPLCKVSMLPLGYSPRITNSVVRRERAVRRLRERITIEDTEAERGQGRIQSWRDSIKKHVRSSPTTPVQAHFAGVPLNIMSNEERRRTRSETARRRMQALSTHFDDRSSVDLRPKWRKALSRAFPGFT